MHVKTALAGEAKNKKEPPKTFMSARVSGTEDKIRLGFLGGPKLTKKLQDVLSDFVKNTWHRAVTIVRWPRSNIIELKLSYEMIRNAGFMEVQQELKVLWLKFLERVQNAVKLAEITKKRTAYN